MASYFFLVLLLILTSKFAKEEINNVTFKQPEVWRGQNLMLERRRICSSQLCSYEVFSLPLIPTGI